MMPPRLVAFASRIGLTGLAIAVLAALLMVQTVRIEGVRIWPISVEGWKPRAERLAGTIEEIRRAQEIAAERARLARLEQERKYEELADNADEREAEIRRDAMAAADEYIRTHRLRTAPTRSEASQPGTSAESGGAGVPESVPPDSFVVVSDADLRACTRSTVYALEAHKWAVSLSGQQP